MAADPLPASTHFTKTLDLNADSTEFCPADGLHDVLAVGTYQLQEDIQERIGKLYLYSVQWSAGPSGSTQEGQGGDAESKSEVPSTSNHPQPTLNLSHTTDVPGIFDLKWRPRGVSIGSTRAMLGAALADGSLRLYSLVQVNKNDIIYITASCVSCVWLCCNGTWAHKCWGLVLRRESA